MVKTFFLVFSLLALFSTLKVSAAEIICDPGVWDCCSSTSHHKCNATGTGYGSCYYCTYGCNSLTGNCKSAPVATPRPATATPIRIPTATPTRCCMGDISTQNSYCGQFTYYQCINNSVCIWNCTVPTNTPRPTATPAPTSPPIICYPNSVLCVDPEDSYDVAKLKTCNSTGTRQTTTLCGEFQRCNRYHTSCIDTIGSYTFRNSGCSQGSTKCELGQKYTCVSSAWLPNVDSSGCPQLSPTTRPVLSAYDCQLVNGKIICPQNSSAWTNTVYPAQCVNSSGNLIPNPQPLGNYGCGQATVCSMLCSCPDLNNAGYCNLVNCVKNISDYSQISCLGTGVDLSTKIIKKFPNCYSTVVNINQSIQNGNLVSHLDLEKYANYGDVLVQGVFTDKLTGKTYNHNSRICGKSNGKLVFCDTFFNSSNSDPALQNVPATLEDRFTIEYKYAALVAK